LGIGAVRSIEAVSARPLDIGEGLSDAFAAAVAEVFA